MISLVTQARPMPHVIIKRRLGLKSILGGIYGAVDSLVARI